MGCPNNNLDFKIRSCSIRHMKAALRYLGAVTLLVASVFGCDFQYDRVSRPHYYRTDGWALPGRDDVNPSAKVNLYGVPLVNVPSVTVRIQPHDDDPYIARFPAQVFTVDGVRQKMRPMLAKATMVRIEVNGRVVAYSYGLIPISAAHKKNGQWVVEGELACIFFATYVDDRGDGVFRDLVPGVFTVDMIPAWAKPADHS